MSLVIFPGIVASYFATREMFRRKTGLDRARLLALLATLAVATSLWHTRSSRVAFAAIGVPFLQVPGNYFLWRGLNTGRRMHFIISGILLAALMYIYLSGSFAPFVFLVFFLLQWLIAVASSRRKPPSSGVSPSLLKQHFGNLVICAGVAFVLFLPMLYFYLTAPDIATERAQQALFTNPIINQGDPWGTLWRSIWGNLAAFGLSTSWLQRGAPFNLILPVPLSVLFVLGFAISTWRIRQPPYLFILVYWGIMLIPSILSPDSIPHQLRAVGAAPAAYTLVAVGAVGLVEMGQWVVGRLTRLVDVHRERVRGVYAPSVLKLQSTVTGLILLGVGLAAGQPVYQGFHYYLVEWPNTNDAQADFHVYAVELAAEMSQETNSQATFLLPRDTAAGDINPNYTVMFLYTGQAGYAWVVDDEDTLEVTLNDAVRGREQVHVVRWKTSKHTGADPKEIIRYYLEKHGTFVERRSSEYYELETYQLDDLGPDLTDGPLSSVAIDFGGQITLVGYAFGDASGLGKRDSPSVPAGNLLWVRLRSRLTRPSLEDLKASVLVTDSAGHVVGQIDKLLLNNVLHQGSARWEPGTEVDAYFLIPVAPATAPGDYHLGVAIYGADTLARLPTSSGDSTQVASLGTIAVGPDLWPPPVEALGLSVALEQPVTDAVTLVGFTTAAGETLRPGEHASLSLVWRAEDRPADDYHAAVWVTQEEQAWTLTDSLPLAGIDYPSSGWVAGQLVRGWFDGRVPPTMTSGDYSLVVRVVESDRSLLAEVPLGMLRVRGWKRRFDMPTMQATVAANFGDRTELLGYDMSALAEGNAALEVVLYWRALSEMDVSYTAFVHLLDGTGQVVSQVDQVPGSGAFPTTGWLPGEVIADKFVVALPEGESPAALQLEVGIYDPATGERLPVLADVEVNDRILLQDALPVTP